MSCNTIIGGLCKVCDTCEALRKENEVNTSNELAFWEQISFEHALDCGLVYEPFEPDFPLEDDCVLEEIEANLFLLEQDLSTERLIAFEVV